MNSFSMAFDNFRRNVKVYALYLMSMIFSVVVYYNFISLKYNPDFINANATSDYIKGVSTAVTYLLLLFMIFFIWFSSSFFLKQRKKEIGIYAFMGVANTQIALIYSIEMLFMGITAIASGLLLGVVFCRLFLMLLAKVAILDVKVRFFFSAKAMIETSGVFLAIFLANSVLGYANIARSKLIDLFNASKKEEQLPKASWIKGIAALVFIGVGYCFAVKAPGANFMRNLPLAIFFVTLGTFLLFGAACTLVMRLLLNRKKLLYNGVNIVSISNIAFRIRNNYRTLATVAMLVTMTLTAYGTVASLKYFVEIRDSIQKPYLISYISDQKDVQQEVRRRVEAKGKTITQEENMKFLMVKAHVDTGFGNPDEETVVVRHSDFVRISRDLKARQLKKIEKMSLTQGQTLYVDYPAVVMSLADKNKGNASVGDRKYVVKGSLKTPLFGNGLQARCLVMCDKDYDDLKASGQEFEFHGINASNDDGAKELAEELKGMDSIKDSLHARMGKDKESQSIFGIIYFFGAFLALVFMIATGSIIYFKLVSEACMDKEKYRMLKRIGMTYKEACKAVSRQIGISYAMPLVVGIIHSCVAMYTLSDMMHYNIIVPSVISMVMFAAIYGIYFVATTKKYLKTVM